MIIAICTAAAIAAAAAIYKIIDIAVDKRRTLKYCGAIRYYPKYTRNLKYYYQRRNHK